MAHAHHFAATMSLESLADSVATAPVYVGRESSDDAAAASENAAPKYCKYDAIKATLAASRQRSYEQGRQGCCGKAADHLGAGPPPADSPWSRNNR